MARYLVFTMEETSARARLLDDLAPETCRAVWKLLPLAGPCGHVMLGGTSCALSYRREVDATKLLPWIALLR